MEYYCMEQGCFKKTSEKATWCDDCKVYMEAEDK